MEQCSAHQPSYSTSSYSITTYMRAISERFRDKELIIKCYINSPSVLLLFTFFTDTGRLRADLGTYNRPLSHLSTGKHR